MVEAEPALRHLESVHGVFLRKDLLRMGYDDRALRRLLRSGSVHRVRQGSYVFSDTWAAADAEARHVTLAQAVLLRAGNRAIASHVSATLLQGMPVYGVGLGRAHVTRLDGGAGRTERDVVHHEGLCLDEDLREVGAFRSVSPVRAVLETAILGGVEAGLVSADAGLRTGLFAPDDLARQHRLMESWPGAQPLHLVTRLADGSSESVGESRCKHLFWRGGLPAPVLQFPVCDGAELVGYADFAWPELGLLAEFDGRIKYAKLLRPGEDATQVVVREKLREDRMRECTGWPMIRLTWSDLSSPERTLARIRAFLGVRALSA